AGGNVGYAVLAANQLSFGATYWWRVRASETRANPLSDVSLPRRFTLAAKAVSYAFALDEQGGGFAVPLQTKLGLAVPEHAADPPLPDQGSFEWRVVASDPAGNLATSSAFTIVMKDSYPPPVPELLAPPDRELLLDPGVTFQWTAVNDPNGVRYTLEIGQRQDFSDSVAIDVVGGNVAYAVLAADRLDFGATYWWRVRASETRVNPLSVISLPRRFTLAAKAVSYAFALDEQGGGFAVPVQTKPGLAGTEHTADPPLPDEGSFDWRVVATDPAGNQRQADLLTIVMQDQYPPPLPELLAPERNAILLDPAVTFQWTPVSDANGVSYTLEISKKQDFSDGVLVSVAGLAVPYAMLGAAQLDFGTTYHWRVQVSETRPAPLTNVTPSQPFQLLDRTVLYALEVDQQQSETFTSFLRRSGLNEPAYELGDPLPDQGVYRWRVRASDPAGNSRTVGDLTMILADRYAPPRPELLFPSPDEQLLNPAVSFSWTKVNDINGVAYTVEVS
ncbi:MAG: hypothetical protein FJ125_18615, partial [Deltaproteobacteria bacterium]|nr:hypothetical protein [Deltaproteobacteria bacterium]